MRYIVDREKRTVYAILEDCDKELRSWVEKRLAQLGKHSDIFVASMEIFLGKDFNISSSFVGKAKCAEEDEFDIETGKILAARRAQEKYEKARTRLLERMTSNLIKKMIEMNLEQGKRYNLATSKVFEAEQLVRIVGSV